MSNDLPIVVLAAAVAAFVLNGCAPAATQPSAGATVNYEGLEQVSARGLDVAFVRPGVEFSAYRGLIVGAPALAFRTPDRSGSSLTLSPEQQARFRDALEQNFRTELGSLERLRLVQESGPDVLKLDITVQDISARVQPGSRTSGAWSNIVLDAVGEATLILELRDSESAEILARGVDARAIEGAAMRQSGGGVASTWAEVEDLCARWASIARTRLDAVIDQR